MEVLETYMLYQLYFSFLTKAKYQHSKQLQSINFAHFPNTNIFLPQHLPNSHKQIEKIDLAKSEKKQNNIQLQQRIKKSLNIPLYKFIKIFYFFLYTKSPSKQSIPLQKMGCCKSKIHNHHKSLLIPQSIPHPKKQKPINPNCKYPNIQQSQKQNLQINIQISSHKNIFQNITCPVNNQILSDLYNQLVHFSIPTLGINGLYQQQWKQVTIQDNSTNWWYIGQWKNNQMHGQGLLYYKLKQRLINALFFQNHIIKFKCRLIFQSGSYYIGPINSFYQPNGHGQMYFNDNTKYVGYFISGIPHNCQQKEKDLNQSFNNLEIYKHVKNKKHNYKGLLQKTLNIQNTHKLHKNSYRFSVNQSTQKSNKKPKYYNQSLHFPPVQNSFIFAD